MIQRPDKFRTGQHPQGGGRVNMEILSKKVPVGPHKAVAEVSRIGNL